MKDAVFTSDAPGALFDMAVGAEQRGSIAQAFLTEKTPSDRKAEKERQAKGQRELG